MTILRDQIQRAIAELDGDVGTNLANVALTELVTAYESGLRLSLNKPNNVLEFVNDLDTALEEILAFRNNLVTAINTNASEIAEPDRSGKSTPQWNAIVKSALIHLNGNTEDPTLNANEALEEVDEDDTLSLFECEVGLIDHNNDPTTVYDTLTVLVASENAIAAETNAVAVADEYITNKQGALSGISFKLMDDPELVEIRDYIEQSSS